MEAIILITAVGSNKAFFPIIIAAITKAVGVKHGTVKLITKQAKEIAKDQIRDTVSDAIKKKKDKVDNKEQ
jgi:hypothetical protein